MEETATVEPKAPVPHMRAKPELKRLPATLERFSVRADSYAYADIDVTMPVGHTVEDALKPEYWALHAHKMKKPQFSSGPDWAGAISYLRRDDHAFFAQLYVRAVRQNSIDVALLGEPVYFGPKAIDAAGFEPRWNVGKRGFDIIRKSDRVQVADGKDIRTKDDVQRWLEENKKAS